MTAVIVFVACVVVLVLVVAVKIILFRADVIQEDKSAARKH